MATIRKRGDSYQIIVSCGYDSNHKQILKRKTYRPEPVSYTHLDVYKRQFLSSAMESTEK